MASVTFSPSILRGRALVPPAKSEAHRALLLAAFATQPCCLNGFPKPLCDDTCAMLSGISALGATWRHMGTQIIVEPIPDGHPASSMVECDVHACAAALRMLIPAFLVRGQAVRFVMDPALFKRPLDAFEPLIKKLNAEMKRIENFGNGRCAVEVSGHLPRGSYEIDGSRSSQFASGMLIALAQAAPSELLITGPIVSRPYLDMTLGLMKHFGLPFAEQSEGFFRLSRSAVPSPESADVTGDWSQAAVFLCMNALGNHIEIENLTTGMNSLQGDSRIVQVLDAMMQEGRLCAGTIDCSDIPDLAPILALTCSQADGVSTLTGVSRLRIKESDRLLATQELLAKLGVHTEVSQDSDTLRVFGPAPLCGGFEAVARSDHRLVMFLAAAALIADKPITVHGVECLNKSWPGFLETYRQLGGKAE